MTFFFDVSILLLNDIYTPQKNNFFNKKKRNLFVSFFSLLNTMIYN